MLSFSRPHVSTTQLRRRKIAGHDKHPCPARAVVQLDPLHIRPSPAVGSSCTTALHTRPAHARRGPGCTHHPPRASNSRRRYVHGGCTSLPPIPSLVAATAAPRTPS